MTPAARRRADRDRRREQQRRHRQRLAAGRRVYAVELDGAILDLLVRLYWLDDGATENDRAVACAVTAMLTNAARKLRPARAARFLACTGRLFGNLWRLFCTQIIVNGSMIDAYNLCDLRCDKPFAASCFATFFRSSVGVSLRHAGAAGGVSMAP